MMHGTMVHQLSSLRDSHFSGDSSSTSINYHDFPGGPTASMHSAGIGLHPRALQGGVPLSSLATSSSGGNLLSSTMLDISASNSFSPSNSNSFSDHDQPQSKSEQDLAHYLATSNPNPDNQDQTLNREPTLLLSTSLSGGGWNSQSEVFDRAGGYLSWSQIDSLNPSNHHEPSSSTSEAAIRPYNPTGNYYSPAISPVALQDSIATHNDTWSSRSRSGSVPHPASDPSSASTPTHGPSPALSTATLPLPSSVLRVNVNSGPSIPIQYNSPLLHAVPLPPVLSPYPHAEGIPDNGELQYPDPSDYESQQRYVNLSDLTSPPPPAIPPPSDDGVILRRAPRKARASSTRAKPAKRAALDRDSASEGEGYDGAAKRPRLGLRSRPSAVTAGSPSIASRSASPTDSAASSESEEDEADFDADDSGEFVPGRRVTSGGNARKRAQVKQEENDAWATPSVAPKRSGTRVPARKRHTGSAAQALRVVMELSKSSTGSSASVSASANTGAANTSTEPMAAEPYSPESQTSSGIGAAYPADLKTEPNYSLGYSPQSHFADLQPHDLPSASMYEPSLIPESYSYRVPVAVPFLLTADTSLHSTASAFSGGMGYTSSSTPLEVHSTRRNNAIPLPVPVPNLIKKSRGRHVPAPEVAAMRGGDPRAYVCEVSGCGKGFVRGEHLKRHVRSIHTHEKPHKCPFEGCDKAFSRRDNLAQHSRIHLPPIE